MDSDIIIIGAGIAGLACGDYLTRHGKKVLLLEARNRLGGRIDTDISLGKPVDMGAAAIIGHKGNPLTSLCQPHYPLNDKNTLIFSATGERLSYQQNMQLRYGYQRYCQALYEQAYYCDDDSKRVADALTEVKELEHLAWYQFLFEQQHGASLEALSLKYLSIDEVHPGGDLMLPAGFSQVIKKLASSLNIKLNTPVVEINYDDDGVAVHSAQRTWRAQQVAITVPLGVLKKQAITFQPELPSNKQKAINTLGISHVNKVALHFGKRFWPLQFEHFSCLGANAFYMLNMAAIVNEAILVFYFAGEQALAIEKKEDGEVIDELLQYLTLCFGQKCIAPRNIRRSFWSADDFSGGAYSYLPPLSDEQCFFDLAKPIAERCYFAGEACHSQFYGTVHGAYLSGQNTARQMLNT